MEWWTWKHDAAKYFTHFAKTLRDLGLRAQSSAVTNELVAYSNLFAKVPAVLLHKNPSGNRIRREILSLALEHINDVVPTIDVCAQSVEGVADEAELLRVRSFLDLLRGAEHDINIVLLCDSCESDDRRAEYVRTNYQHPLWWIGTVKARALEILGDNNAVKLAMRRMDSEHTERDFRELLDDAIVRFPHMLFLDLAPAREGLALLHATVSTLMDHHGTHSETIPEITESEDQKPFNRRLIRALPLLDAHAHETFSDRIPAGPLH
jgi:hypothetical protein